MDHKSILRTYLLKILLPCELSRLGNTSSIRTLQKRMLVKWSREEKLSCVQCAACRPGHPRPWALTMGTYFQWHGQKLWLNNLLDTISLKFWFMTFGGSFADTWPLWPIPMTVAVGCKYFFLYIFCKTNKYVFIAQDLDWKRDIETFQSKWPANKRAGQAPAWLWAVYRRFDCGHNNCTQLHC